ncbi:MAG: DUF3991 domain-containing protein [bacterium]|nr:DUF3991 domain-containing protein [bacterium]
MDRDTELEAFKACINLSEFAASMGYLLDRKASCSNSAVMCSPDGDKVVIARDTDSHWIYFSVRNERDNGSIIDFLQKRRPCSLGDVRMALRPWIGESANPPMRPPVNSYAPKLETSSKDLTRVQAAFAAMEPITAHLYLTSRNIPAAVLSGPRLAGKMYTDSRRNVVFPHYNSAGLCGYEIKNQDFTGFAKGGAKGLWFSAVNHTDRAAVIAETAIDAISYHALHPDPYTRLFSTGGSLNPDQPDLIARAASRLPHEGQIIIATDNDPGGDSLADTIRQAVESAERPDLHIIRHNPEPEGQDWNDVLRRSQTAQAQKTGFEVGMDRRGP